MIELYKLMKKINKKLNLLLEGEQRMSTTIQEAVSAVTAEVSSAVTVFKEGVDEIAALVAQLATVAPADLSGLTFALDTATASLKTSVDSMQASIDAHAAPATPSFAP